MKASYIEPSNMNRFWLGFFLGLSFPLIFFLLYYLFRFKDLTFGQYFNFLAQTGKIVHVLSLSVFPNLIPFMLFVRSDRYKAGRGVMAITIVYGLSIFALKLMI